jgi:hypothetical protein
MKLEAGVAASPAPTVSTEAGTDGTVTLSLMYADANTGQTSSLSFSV